MSKKSKEKLVSIRVRLESDLLNRLDRAAGTHGRERFIRDSILYRLDEAIPPFVMSLAEEVDKLRARLDYLEASQSTSVHLSRLSKVTKEQICRDDLDRELLTFFLQNEGATTPEIAKSLLGSISKRRTILDRIERLNERAEEIIGVPLLLHEKGRVKDKRGAWWLVNIDKILD